MPYQPMIALEEKRFERGDTTEAFARYLGIARTTYKGLLHGEATISPATQEHVAAVLGVSVEQIWEFVALTDEPEVWEQRHFWGHRYDPERHRFTNLRLFVSLHPPPRRRPRRPRRFPDWRLWFTR